MTDGLLLYCNYDPILYHFRDIQHRIMGLPLNSVGVRGHLKSLKVAPAIYNVLSVCYCNRSSILCYFRVILR